LADCIDRGWDQVRAEQETIREHGEAIQEVATTLNPKEGDGATRQEKFEELIERFASSPAAIHQPMAKVMISCLAGLFVGGAELDGIKDNRDRERWFRRPKSHERRIHGHRHAGIRIVPEGPPMVPALDAQVTHPQPFTVEDRLPDRTAREPPCQPEALARRQVMRKPRSPKKRPILLATLERRYREALSLSVGSLIIIKGLLYI
jgi:hypothetical protein